MRKKGFTLIELLAVIVILAIIALIATPIVMNVIENSRKGAAERSAENYIDAVELAIASERLEGPVTDGEYKIQEDGSLCIVENGTVDCDKSQLNVEVNGEKPSAGGTILIEKGQVVDKLTGNTDKKTTITIGNYTASYNEDGKIEATKGNAGSSKTVVYRWSEDTISIEQEIDPTDTTKFTTDPSTLGKDYYLKHVLNENNVVTESYVCAKYADNEEPTCIRGGSAEYYGYAENEANYAGNALILKGLQDEGFGCYFDAYDAYCNGGSVGLHADSDGNVFANVGNDYCRVLGDGSSDCVS